MNVVEEKFLGAAGEQAGNGSENIKEIEVRINRTEKIKKKRSKKI